MVSVGFGALSVMVVAILTLALPVVVLWTVFKVVQAAAWAVATVFRLVRGVLRHCWGFLRGIATDLLHFAGGLLTAAVIFPLAILNVIIGRWSAAGHYGRALEDELMSAAACLYRVALGHPIRLLGLGVLTDGLERRLPDLVARAPRAPQRRRKPSKPAFDGYKIVGDLPAGGSGARLYLAKPSFDKVQGFRAKGFADPGQVVIKSFGLGDGSTLPQIVRESRALEAAGRLGLVLEHELTSDHFHYVMPFVPGEDLDVVTRRAHREAGPGGLTDVALRQVLGYACDLLSTLERFHEGGLWHKDIKPTNLIVSSDRVHLVDLGLVTPLESGMTLTTHGTEYFRDPELVRMALKGVKVHEVDGVKFDLYSAGAVLYSMIENSFPAHGSLSRITKRCPDAVQWIVRRSMADVNGRYASAAEMLADLRTALAARDPFAVRPAELPSVGGAPAPEDTPRPTPAAHASGHAAEPIFAASNGHSAWRRRRTRAARRAGFRATRRASKAAVTDTATVRRRTRRHTMAAAFLAVFFGVFVAASKGLLQDPHRRVYQPMPAISVNTSPMELLEGFGERAREAVRRAGASFEKGRSGSRKPSAPRKREEPLHSDAEKAWAAQLGSKLPDCGTLPEPDARYGAGTGPTVLVLEDLRPSADPEILEGLHGYLLHAGYRAAGLMDGAELGDDELAWTAGARRAIGLSDPTDGEALERLQDFVDGASSPLRAVLWVSQEASGAPGQSGGHVQYHLVKRTTALAAVPQAFEFHAR